MADPGGNMVAEVPQCKSNMNTRFSTIRFSKAAAKFNPIQIGHITRHNMSHMLNIPYHLMIRMNLLQWLVDHSFSFSKGSYFIQHKEKKIVLTKDIVDKFFGFEHGVVPYRLESDDPNEVREVEFLRRQYLVGSTIPVGRIESIMLGANEERVFLRSFVMFYLATILCPTTYNALNPKFLYSLTDRNILLVEFYDFGSLCLDHLFAEIDNWRTAFLTLRVDQFNNDRWIGGCLPVLGVSYLDFVDFNGNGGTIDYRLPRMAHIKNADFKLLQRFDRNKKSRKAYGVLPIRDISLTPYALPLVIHPLHQLPAIALPQLPEPVEDVGYDSGDNVNESPDIIDISSSAETHGGYSDSDNVPDSDEGVSDDGFQNVADLMEHVQGSTSSDTNGIINAANNSNDGNPVDASMDTNHVAAESVIHHVQDTIFIGDGLFNIAASYAEDSPLQQESVAEGFVSGNPNDDNTAEGIANSEQHTVCEPSFVQSSLDKKNRKKRAAKTSSPDNVMSNLFISSAVDAFYTKFTRNKFVCPPESPLFIDIGGCPVTYETFWSSFKPRGNVADDVMCAQAQVFNEESKQSAAKKPFIKKHMFSSFIAAKLMEDPSSFDKAFVATELSRVSHEINIVSLDILHFPTVMANHWVSACLNPLFGTMHFFDPACLANESAQRSILQNLACNFSTVCKELNIDCKGIEKLTISSPKYPAHSLLHDCGFYVMLYAENFNGKIMKHFTKEIIPKYRMLKAYKMFYSKQNEVEADVLERIKKRKM